MTPKPFNLLISHTPREWLRYFAGYEFPHRSIERRARRLEFAENTLHVNDEGRGLQPFRAWDAQRYIWLNHDQLTTTNKGREEGLTAVTQAWQTIDQAFDGGSNLIAGNKEETSKNIVGYAKQYVRDMDERWGRILIPEYTASALAIDFYAPDSVPLAKRRPYKVTRAFSATDNIASSFRFIRANLSEVAKWPPNIAQEMYNSLQGTMDKFADEIIESTPKGLAGLHSEIWHDYETRGYERFDFSIYGMQRLGMRRVRECLQETVKTAA